MRELRPEISKRNSLSEAKQTASAEKVVSEEQKGPMDVMVVVFERSYMIARL